MSDLPEKFRNTLTIGDSISGLREIPDGSIHMILSDTPYASAPRHGMFSTTTPTQRTWG